MFEAFQQNFPRDTWREPVGRSVADVPSIPGLREFFRDFGGASFRGGLYRATLPSDAGAWNERIGLAFPQFKGCVVCFGFDWLGGTFAIDTKRLHEGQFGIVMFEPGTGKALEIPSNFQSFHDLELLKFGEAALAIGFYKQWIDHGGAPPAYSQCIGYKKPLFLGGVDETENLELSDLDVYWHLMGQLIAKARGLPTGTPIRVSKS